MRSWDSKNICTSRPSSAFNVGANRPGAFDQTDMPDCISLM